MVESEFATRLRALAEARNDGIISDAEYEASRRKLLQANTSLPSSATTKSSDQRQLLLCLALLVAGVGSIFTSRFSYDSFGSWISFESAVAWVTAIVCSLAAFRLRKFRTLDVTIWVAAPLLLVSMLYPMWSYFFSGFSLVGGLSGISASIQVVSTLAVFFAFAALVNDGGWRFESNISSTTVFAALGSVSLCAFVFVDAWQFESGSGRSLRTVETGSFWLTNDLWTTLAGVFVLLAFAAPLLVSVTRSDRRSVTFVSVGTVLGAISLYALYIKGMVVGDYSPNMWITLLLVGVGSLVILGVTQFDRSAGMEEAVDVH